MDNSDFSEKIKKLFAPIKYLLKNSKKIFRHPFLYLGFFSIILTLCVIVLFNLNYQGKQSKNANIFNKGQYLFSDTGEAIPHIDLNIVSNSVLAPIAPPFLVQGKILASYGPENNKEIAEYIVKPGDTLSSIAKKFGISLQTILWANNLTSKSIVKPKQKLVILPVTGVMHIVHKGDTLSEIAETYKSRVKDIVEFNELGDESKIFAGDFLIIPNGKKPKTPTRYSKIPLSSAYFIAPIPYPARITQGLHWFNAVDFSNGRCNDPVYAVAGGTIQRTGYTSIGGRYVRILHSNGVVTYYGHLSKIVARPGQKVRQGEIIGYIGYSGRTIPAGPAGCHVHFDVRFAKNPFARYKVGDIVKN